MAFKAHYTMYPSKVSTTTQSEILDRRFHLLIQQDLWWFSLQVSSFFRVGSTKTASFLARTSGARNLLLKYSNGALVQTKLTDCFEQSSLEFTCLRSETPTKQQSSIHACRDAICCVPSAAPAFAKCYVNCCMTWYNHTTMR